MYTHTLKVTCGCGAALEIEFNLDLAIRSESMFNKFIEAHKNCREYNSGPTTNVTNTNPKEKPRLDEMDKLKEL